MASQNYRPDIDGIRALAVLSILFFHLGFENFSGGFVGVDIFFVISGYLITNNIYTQLKAGSFSFGHFYAKRARRLFPALFFTIFVTVLIATFLFYPVHLERLGTSIIYVVMSLSNIFFWSEAGYFDTSAEFKPLLHTWSLSVEEQFYLVWPITLVLLYKLKNKYAIPVFLFISSIVSLYFTELFIISDPSAAYFLAPFRIMEFAFGAGLVWLRDFRLKKNIYEETLFLIGLFLVVYPILAFSKSTEFPGLAAIIPSMGAAILIFTGRAKYSGIILRNKVAVSIGLISYSLYLAHWPVVVFLKYWKNGVLGPKSIIIALILTFLIAIFMYFFIEKKFRYTSVNKKALSDPAFGFSCAMLALFVVFFGVNIWSQKGWDWRYSTEKLAVLESIGDIESKRQLSWDHIAEYQENHDHLTEDLYVVLGDSHSKDIFNSIILNESNLNIRRINVDYKCQPIIPGDYQKFSKNTPVAEAKCNIERKAIFENPVLKKAKYILVVASWDKLGVEGFSRTLGYLKEKFSGTIIVFGPRMKYFNIPTLMLNHGVLDKVDEFVDKYKKNYVVELNLKLKKIAEKSSVGFVDVYSIFCQSSLCPIVTGSNKSIYYDGAHWTLEGAKYFGEKFKSTNTVESILIFKK